MTAGDILYATHNGVCVIKLVGDICYTTGPAALISRSLDTFLERLFADGKVRNVIVDMSETSSIDSTNLGVLAKLVTFMMARGAPKPTVLSPRTDITRTLESVGFDRVFHLIRGGRTTESQLERLPGTQGNQREELRLILDAHKRLMELNDHNRQTFKDAVNLLESELKN